MSSLLLIYHCYFFMLFCQTINQWGIVTEIIVQTYYSMSISNFHKYECRSRRSTEEDSSSDRDQQFYIIKTNPAKHKTELCKTYSVLGSCPYGERCRFAHGKHELIQLKQTKRCKDRKCNGFWKNGVCSYGIRCQFGHASTKWQNKAILLGLSAACQPVLSQNSKLMKILF